MRPVDYSSLPAHMQEGARRYIEEGVQPGDFLMAVLENNFTQAATRADWINNRAAPDWAWWLLDLPRQCWGSPEIVAAWIAQGGAKGEKENVA